MLNLAELMQASPYHRWLGVRLTKAEDGMVEVYLPYRAEFNGDDETPYIHGGIIAALIDLAACFAVSSVTQKDAPTLDLRIDYLRMAGENTDLIATAHTVKVGRTTGLADVEVKTPEGRLIAVGRTSVIIQVVSRDVLTQTNTAGTPPPTS